MAQNKQTEREAEPVKINVKPSTRQMVNIVAAKMGWGKQKAADTLITWAYDSMEGRKDESPTPPPNTNLWADFRQLMTGFGWVHKDFFYKNDATYWPYEGIYQVGEDGNLQEVGDWVKWLERGESPTPPKESE